MKPVLRRFAGLRSVLEVAVLAYSAYEWLTLWRSSRCEAPLEQSSGSDDIKEQDRRIHIFVPALDETAHVARTVEWFRAMACGDAGTYVWFVTTTREISRPATRTLLETAIGSTERLGVIEEDAADGNKASQLNFAVTLLEAGGHLRQTDVVAVFDFDSMPPADLLRWVRPKLEHAAVVQVVPLEIGTLNGPPTRAAARTAVWVDAVSHSRRSLGIEYARLASRRRPVQYVVGAGLFLRREVLALAGGFPYVDDVPLGYRLSALDVTFATVPRFNAVDVPDNFSATLNSMVFVARGVVEWVSVCKDLWSRAGVSRFRILKLAWLGLHDTWEISGYPWTALWLTARWGSAGSLGKLAVIAFWALPPIEMRVLERKLRQISPDALWVEPIWSALMMAPARRFWRTLGTGRLLLRHIKAQATGRTVTFHSTERSIS